MKTEQHRSNLSLWRRNGGRSRTGRTEEACDRSYSVASGARVSYSLMHIAGQVEIPVVLSTSSDVDRPAAELAVAEGIGF